MLHSRRHFVTAAATTLGTLPLNTATSASAQSAPRQTVSSGEIAALFKDLPGDIAYKIYAPAVGGKPELLLSSNSSRQMFIGSAFKTFVLCETLRQLDGPDVRRSIASKQLSLDASVWSLDSATFNPPNLIGQVSLRTALEAMIMHSDNTGTDMCLKNAGPEKVRALIASAELKNTMIPESTRCFMGYLLGSKTYKTFTWDDIGAATNSSVVNTPLNKEQTMASTADDLVSYYSRAVQGAFFKDKETLNQFRRILSLGDAIWLLPLPLGASAFCKGGSIDVEGFHAICAPGAMLFDDRWVYFAIAINWYAKPVADPATVKAFTAAGSRALALVKESLSA
jgi:beta-lactamase class A